MDQALRLRLLALAEDDQRHAKAVYEASQRHDSHRGRFLFDLPREEWLPEYVASVESAVKRIAELRKILDDHQWPGISMVGEDGSRSAWLIAQHAGDVDPDFQLRCERLLTAAVSGRDAKPGQLAALRDRIELEAGRPQLYGSHLEPHGDSWRAVRGIEDRDAVDARRAALGLKPWTEYLADCMNGVPDT
jgi:hypothetical protein